MTRRLWRRVRSPLLRAIITPLARFVAWFSWQRIQRWGHRFGSLAWYASTTQRRRTLAHLEIAFPERTRDERLVLAKACYRHLGCTLFECFYALHSSCERLLPHVQIAGQEHLTAAQATGRPVLMLMAHFGNWELLGMILGCRGVQIKAMARAVDEPGLQDFLVQLRGRFGTQTIRRGESDSVRVLLKTLRGEGVLGILIDQDTQVDGVWVPFFKRLAYTPVGAAKMALRQKAVVLPAFIERLEDGSHGGVIHPPTDLPADANEATALMTSIIEDRIRSRPEQWVWMHRRWRRRPTLPTNDLHNGGRPNTQ